MNWKDIPQDAAGILEWERRYREIFGNRGESLFCLTRSKLDQLADQYGIEYVVVDRRFDPYDWDLLSVYRNETYALYQMPESSAALADP